jgi:hypothetical protein
MYYLFDEGYCRLVYYAAMNWLRQPILGKYDCEICRNLISDEHGCCSYSHSLGEFPDVMTMLG